VKIGLGHELRRILSIYQEQEGTKVSLAIRDAMTELVHVCDENSLDADDLFDAGIEVAIQERLAAADVTRCEHGRVPAYGCCAED